MTTTDTEGGALSDPRAALAEAWRLTIAPDGLYNGGPDWQEFAGHLAERGVLLVTEERLRAAVDRVIDRDDWRGNRPDNDAAAIFDALSGEVTE